MKQLEIHNYFFCFFDCFCSCAIIDYLSVYYDVFACVIEGTIVGVLNPPLKWQL